MIRLRRCGRQSVSQELLKKASAKSLKADPPKFEVGDVIQKATKSLLEEQLKGVLPF